MHALCRFFSSLLYYYPAFFTKVYSVFKKHPGLCSGTRMFYGKSNVTMALVLWLDWFVRVMVKYKSSTIHDTTYSQGINESQNYMEALLGYTYEDWRSAMCTTQPHCLSFNKGNIPGFSVISPMDSDMYRHVQHFKARRVRSTDNN